MLRKVTITGADDNTPIAAILDLSHKFPFVEWAILVSRKQEGSPRFPSRQWMGQFSREVADLPIDVSMHICGERVRQLLRGVLDWNELPEVRIVSDRVQINTHAEEHISTVGMFDILRQRSTKQFIIQLDGVNDHIFDAAWALKNLKPSSLNISGLFDCSHGAGVLPETWPTPIDHTRYYGYAGGLGPKNVVEEVEKISASRRNLDFWIDMEGRVRSDDGHTLDLEKVRAVLEATEPLVTA